MKIIILHIGKTSSKGLLSFIKEFEKRLSRYASVSIKAVDGIKGKKLSPSVVKKEEYDRLQQHIIDGDYVVLLDENGKSMDSRQFAELLEKHQMYSGKRVVFVIGGAYGFDERLYQSADLKVSMSKMTFNHELALAVFTEQLYRAMTILAGHPYHND